jgi:DNA polymerase V
MKAVIELFNKIINKKLLVRRINISANNLIDESKVIDKPRYEQFDLFTDYSSLNFDVDEIKKQEEDEKKVQRAMLEIKRKYGKNAIFKGMNLEEGATARDRNKQVGGHKG